MTKLTKSYYKNLEIIKNTVSYPQNSDLILREFTINTKKDSKHAFIVYFEGMVNNDLIDKSILKPLMLLGENTKTKDIKCAIEEKLLLHNDIKKTDTISEITEALNYGNCILITDSLSTAFIASVKGWGMRTISSPKSETIINGPHEAFVESLRTNTGIIRKILKDNNLICETLNIGIRSKTACSLLYIKDITNLKIVEKIRFRLQNIDIDYIFSTGELEQFLEDNTFLTVSQILSTERPDRTAMSLSEGKVVIMLEGSPYALVLPITIFDFLHTTEDKYIRWYYSNLLRIIRIIAMFVSVFLPATFIAITSYNIECIPPSLLFAIEASREKVPFSMLTELIILEISFEVIREAGIRMPNAIGPTLGIIGALIMGQAAVEANLVSPVLIIIVAGTGIGSFAIPYYSLGYSFRILKFIYIIFAALAGFLGISFVLFIHLTLLCKTESFGIPFLAPLAPIQKSNEYGTILIPPLWKREYRASFLNPQKIKQQSHISRKWTLK